MAVAPKPSLSLRQIITMSFGFMGIQCGFALQNANTSRILRSFGADVDQLPMFWIVAPLVGMIVQPLIGHYSDRTWNRLGRRKPYFLTGAILSSIALVMLPNSGGMAGIIPALWIGAGFVMVMDASFNIAMEPFRALVADNLPENQRTLGFSIQSFLIGIGAVLGSDLPDLLTRIGVSQVAGPDGIANNIKYSFYIGAALFMVAILVTVFGAKEYPPAEYERYHGTPDTSTAEHKGLGSIFHDFRNMPRTMRQLGLAQFFSWFALFSMWVFTTDAVATHVYGLSPTDTKSVMYNEAGNKVGSAFAMYNLIATIYAILLPVIAGKIGRKATHAISLIAGGIGLISIYFIQDPKMLNIAMVGIGLAWASILTMPYVMLSSCLPPGKMGIYMGIFNFFITMPQIINGLFGGWVMKHIFNGQPIYSIVLAGFSLLAAAVCVLFVYDAGETRPLKKAAMGAGLGILFFFVSADVKASPSLDSVHAYPSNWWVGMKNPDLQIMLRGNAIASSSSVTVLYPGVELVRVRRADNPHYAFLNLRIAPDARPGMVTIRIGHEDGSAATLLQYPLLARRKGNGTSYARGVNSSDFIYFLMPDRFSNGDSSNDRIPGMRDQSLDRDSIFLRHGGDIRGIINHLDYLLGLGVTALWLTPVIENDMPSRTEHGYAFTDHYTIDPRLGGASAYKALSDSLHRRGMKLIQDAVYNHVGSWHFLIQDPPSKHWLHQWPQFTQTSYKDQPLMDPYAASIDKKTVSDGWFTTEMPDLDQRNPNVANFLIQHAIWCVETFGVDGWRIDTYIYCDLGFMNNCNKALSDEYPKITEFGETWVHGTANQAYFAENNLKLPFKSNLQGVVDFQCNFSGIVPALTEKFGWTEGVSKLYTTLSNDFLYKDPSRNCIFLDNHDMSRFFSQVGESVAKQKMGISWLLTCRGIPQLYYGTEICMKGFANPDGWVRLDFPGGWSGDKVNAFTGEGLTDDQRAVQALVRTLGNFRRGSSALRRGKLMQYVPSSNGLYVYFRYDSAQTIACVMNTSDNAVVFDASRYKERTAGFSAAVNVVTGQSVPLHDALTVPPMEMWVLELKK